MIRGIKPKRLSSSPIHIVNHEWADRDTRIPASMRLAKRKLTGLNLAEEARIILFIEIGKDLSFLAGGLERLA
jgi:hypothetical protein